ncbi:MAG TPA: TIGR03936 family radical SAM-associated protein, partial [Polyangia bacterium]|nr:TIGR03936 family radical SAM-associated protein [Polyangia bacterium]
RLPWDHLDMQLEPDFLAKEYRKALKDRLSPPCGKPYKQLLHHTNVADAEAGAKQKLVCYDCGIACDLDAMKTERLYYLRRMNAWTPPAPVQPPERRAEDAVGMSRKSRQPTTRPVQGEPRRYRLRYTKLGRIAYLGHLDLIRHLPRIFRRAGLEIFYSVGFHPKPELSFGPALGLGIPSLGELLDVKLIEDLDPADLVRRLNEVSLDGIEFLGGAALGQDDRALGRVVARSGFAARLPLAAQVTSALVDHAQGGALSVVRPSAPGKGGIGKRIDVRKSLIDVNAPDAGAAALLHAKLGWEPERVLTFAVSVSHEGSAKPSEVLEALVGAAVADKADLARLVLQGVGGEGETIDALDTTTLRAVPKARLAETATSSA